MTKLTQEEAIALQKRLMDKALEIVLAKRHDYSGTEDPFRNLRDSVVLAGANPWQGVIIRIGDKFSRIRSIVEAGGVMNVDEALEDTFADIINYTCILAGLVWEELGLEVEE